MKKWKCTVCGYVHTGDEPPDKCPVCGAPKSRFIDITEPESPEPEAAADSKPETATSPEPEPAKTAEPPKAAQPEEPEPVSPFKDSRYRRLFETMTRFHGHPISVHIPNGLLPVCVLFIFLSALFGLQGMARAATYNLGVVALSMPLVLFSGWVGLAKPFQRRRHGRVHRQDRLRHRRDRHRLVSVHLAAGKPAGGYHASGLAGCLFRNQSYHAGCSGYGRVVWREAGFQRVTDP